MSAKIKNMCKSFIALLYKPVKYGDLSDKDKKTYDYIKGFDIRSFNSKERNIVKKIQNNLDENLPSSRSKIGKFIIAITPAIFAVFSFICVINFLSIMKFPTIIDFSLFLCSLAFTMLTLFFPLFIWDAFSLFGFYDKKKLVNHLLNIDANQNFKNLIAKASSLPTTKHFWEGIIDEFKIWHEEKEKESEKDIYLDKNGNIVLKDKLDEVDLSKKITLKEDKI